MMLRRTPLQRKAWPKAKKRPSPPSAEEKQGRELVARRSSGWCELRVECGPSGAPATDWQHRKNRSQGGTWAASNGLHCCRRCHAEIHRMPALAMKNGWTVRSTDSPRRVPVLLFDGVVLLGDDGHRYDPPHVAGCTNWGSDDKNCDCNEETTC